MVLRIDICRVFQGQWEKIKLAVFSKKVFAFRVEVTLDGGDLLEKRRIGK